MNFTSPRTFAFSERKRNALTKMRIYFSIVIICCMSTSSIHGANFVQRHPHCRSIDLFLAICLAPAGNDHHKKPQPQPHPLPIYILYAVNPAEGFNLRRDVYIRLAVFMNHLRTQRGYEGAVLVLPPFQRLYHWKSSPNEGGSGHPHQPIFWNHFFDLPSLGAYTPILDLWQYFDMYRCQERQRPQFINHRIQLRHFENMFDEDGKFVEKFQIVQHATRDKFVIVDDDRAATFGYPNLTVSQHEDVQFQGSVMFLRQLIDELRSKSDFIQSTDYYALLVLNAEIVLHHHWGDAEFWRARRSMRFNQNLVAAATQYRQRVFNGTDETDRVQRPADWKTEKPYRKAIGGEYICAHLRRADFVFGREKTTPSIQSAARQLKRLLKEHQLDHVFISSDCTGQEYRNLKSNMSRYKVRRFQPSSRLERDKLLDGGIAIVDQIICSHARFFIGTYESTFTYRIYEEREILGFPKAMTFNTFCKHEDATNDNDACPKNSIWPIVY